MAGAIFAPVSYLILASVPLTAAGISAVIIGVVCVALANTRPYISPEACQVLLKAGMENTAAMLEELGLSNKAIYLPSSMRDGYQAVVPLGGSDVKNISGKIPGRLIVRYGSKPEDMAIAVTTAGSISIDLLKTKPGATSREIEGAATYVLVGLLDLASSVTVSMTDSQVNAVVNGARLHWEDIWYYRCLGSPIASIIAAISSEALSRAVMIKEENYDRGKSSIQLEVLS